jgi:hypothetical protein
VGLGIVNSVLSALLLAMLGFIGGFSFIGIISFIFGLAGLGICALAIIGIINAAKGEMKPVPVLGTLFTIIK